MNLGQLKTLVCSWLDDPQMTYFTPANLTVWLNNAQRECQKQLIQTGENYYTQKSSTTMVVNQPDYTLPSGFMRCHKLEIVTSGSGVNEVRQMLAPVTLVQLDQVSMSTGQPEAYNIKRNCVSVRPIPDTAFTTYLHWSYEVADMANDTDVPDVPRRYHEYVAVLAALDGFVKDGRDMSQLLAKKESYQQLMKQDAQEVHVDVPRDIIVTEPWGDIFF